MSAAETVTKNLDSSRPATTDAEEYVCDLELDEATFRSLADFCRDALWDHLNSLPKQKLWNNRDPAKAIDQFDFDLQDEKLDSIDQQTKVLQQLFETAIPCSLNAAGPGYMAYVPGGGLVQSGLADWISSTVNRFVGVWQAAPVLATIEWKVIRWFCDLFGYPDSSGGYLASGGSIANWTAVVTAREKILGETLDNGTAYISDQAHHSLRKAIRLAGIPDQRLRVVKTDSQLRMCPDHLSQLIATDFAEGRKPFFVAATAGTTNSGAVDPIESISEICAKHKIWFHIDAAYGGFFALTEQGRKVLKGMKQSDSITVDPHKGLFAPYGTGGLLVRELDDLRKAHQMPAEYLPEAMEEQEQIDFAEISPELSRNARGLRIWLPLKLCGLTAFQNALQEKLELAQEAAASILSMTDGIPGKFELTHPPELSLFAFRWLPPDLSDNPEIDQINRELLDDVNGQGRVYLTGTRIRERFVIRVCILSFRTHRLQIQHLIEDLASAIKTVATRWNLAL